MLKRFVLITVAATLFILQGGRDAWAIPVFARKYETSCHTCHIAYPKLNPFGNAFRLRGYRMPAETEEMIKEVPVPLGADAYKRVWPRQIWPSDIPGTVPLAIDMRLSSVTQHDAAADTTLQNDLRFPETIDILTAGTLGETISFLGGLGFVVQSEHGQTEVDVEIEHAELRFNGPWGSGTTFNAKFGRFTPEISQGFSHGYLLTESTPAVMFGFNPVGIEGSNAVAGFGHGGGHGGGGTISMPIGVDGIEMYGILGSRFEYSGGISNGVGAGQASRDVNNTKDVYGRIAYKFGGLSLDGEEYVESAQNWRENSLQLGVFGYRGNGEGMRFAGTGDHVDALVEDQEFTRVGFDVNIFARDLNVIAGFVRGRDTLAVFEFPDDEHGEPDEHGEADDEHAEINAQTEADEHGEAGEDEHGETAALELSSIGDFTYNSWFAELDYVFYPWLHGAYRYELLDPSRRGAANFKRVTANVTALIRANVKALVEWQRDVGRGPNDYVVKAALRFAF